jgi:hypothetical protein
LNDQFLLCEKGGACSTYKKNEEEMHTAQLENLKERHHLGVDEGIDRDQQWQYVLK